MKRKQSSGSASKRPASPPAGTNLSVRRKRLFRLAALAFPVALLLASELVLRLAGYGYPTTFFLQDGRNALIENQRFGERFFPPGLARTPQPMRIAAAKPPDVVRIFVLGESAAMGDPEPAFGFSRVLEAMLRAGFPRQKFEVVNVAMTAINSHVIREIARDCAMRQGDLWIIYAGNNEVVGPYGAGTVFGAQVPSLSFIRASLALKSTRLGQWLDSVKHSLTSRGSTPTEWEGMEMFLKQQVTADDPRLPAVYAHFQNNLTDIITLGKRAGTPVLVSTVVSNLKDCPPFAAQHSKGLAPAQLAEWERLFQAGAAQQAATNFAAALGQFIGAAKIDDLHAELHFQIARCRAALGKTAEARESFARARDLDALRFRADTRINQIIRDTTASQQVTLVDAAGAFAAGDEIPGEDSFFEHVHFNFTGNYRLASLLLPRVIQLLPAKLAATSNNAVPSLADCERALAFTDWDRAQLTDEVWRRLQQAPFTTQSNHAERDERLQRPRNESKASLASRPAASLFDAYRQALATTPDDWKLHENLAKCAQAQGDVATAEAEWRAVLRRLPHHVAATYSLGNILDTAGRSAEAMTFFDQALRLKPDSLEARNARGLALASQGRSREAIAEFERALRQKPAFVEARVNLGQTLATLGRREEAVAQYTNALGYDSNSVAAHINLGKILASQRQTTEAIAHYEAALRTNPDSAVAHFNLGNALAGRRDPEAATHYAAAARLRANFPEAHYALALELAQQGKNPEALDQFAEAVRLRPAYVEAHLNLGVALARAQRVDEAIAQFREALRLDPANAQARKYLDQAEKRRGATP